MRGEVHKRRGAAFHSAPLRERSYERLRERSYEWLEEAKLKSFKAGRRTLNGEQTPSLWTNHDVVFSDNSGTDEEEVHRVLEIG